MPLGFIDINMATATTCENVKCHTHFSIGKRLAPRIYFTSIFPWSARLNFNSDN